MNAQERLLTFPRFGSDGVNERMIELVQDLSMVPTIKIVGSNGKGTAAHTMAQMAQGLGKTVGLYTSPHLLRMNERIRVNGRDIGDRDLKYILTWALDRVGDREGVGRFEIFTLAALYHFSQCEVDVAIMEIGLGGRFDPVRVAPGDVSVLTSIDLEHTAILGDTIEQIATEKAAVCKNGDLLLSGVSGLENCMPEGVIYKDITQPVLAPLQSNARLAAHALKEHFKLDVLPETYGARVPGRLHKVSRTPSVYVDVAHSTQAVQTVLDQLKGMGPITLICAARNDKDFENISGDFHHVIALQFDEAMHDAQDILRPFDAPSQQVAQSVEEALNMAVQNRAENGIILCLGGFGLAGRVLAHYQGVHYDVISL